jgi:hypothetical protein
MVGSPFGWHTLHWRKNLYLYRTHSNGANKILRLMENTANFMFEISRVMLTVKDI